MTGVEGSQSLLSALIKTRYNAHHLLILVQTPTVKNTHFFTSLITPTLLRVCVCDRVSTCMHVSYYTALLFAFLSPKSHKLHKCFSKQQDPVEFA